MRRDMPTRDTVTTWNGQVWDVIGIEDLPAAAPLRYAALEHDEMTMPQAIQVRDREGRWAIYAPEGERKMRAQDRPQDSSMDGSDLRYTRLEQYESGAPASIEVRDQEGRAAIYVPLEIEGKMVRPRPAIAESATRQ